MMHLQLLYVRLHPYQIKCHCVACFSKMHRFCFSNVEIAVTSDGNTIVCYHPTEDVSYELTQVRMMVCEDAEDRFVEMLFISVCVLFVSCSRSSGQTLSVIMQRRTSRCSKTDSVKRF